MTNTNTQFSFTSSFGEEVFSTVSEAMAAAIAGGDGGVIRRVGDGPGVTVFPELGAAAPKWWPGHDGHGFGGEVPAWARICAYLLGQRMPQPA